MNWVLILETEGSLTKRIELNRIKKLPMTGFDPGTFRLQGECSNQLSYIGELNCPPKLL